MPAPLDPESLFPSRPSLKAIATSHRLLLLRRAVIVAWVGPLVAVAVWAAYPWTRNAGRRMGSWWLRQNRDNGRRAWSSASPATTAPRRARVGFGGLYVLVAGLFLASLWPLHDPQTGFTSLIAFDEQFRDRALPVMRTPPHDIGVNSGFDGQFYAQLALEPRVRNRDLDKALDSVEVRPRRIFAFWTAFMLGMGRPSWILQAYAIQNVDYWLLLGSVLLRLLPPFSARNWLAWCGCLLGGGAITSVLRALTDLPGAALMVSGIAAAESGAIYVGGCLLGLSGLTRETSLLGVIGNDWPREWNGRSRLRTLFTLVLVVLPFAVWDGNPGAFVRALLPMTLAYNVLLPESRWFWPLLVLGNMTVVPVIQILWLLW